MSLEIVIHDECDAEKSWITQYRINGDLVAAECGGVLGLSHLDVLNRQGLPTHKRRSFSVNVQPGVNVDVYVYRESRALMHVAVRDGVALVLTLRPYDRPIDNSNAEKAAKQRLRDWWTRYGQLRKI